MWLSRFSRELASWRANGISAEISVDRNPRFRNCSSRGTELLIPTPSSAVSHMEGSSKEKLERWSIGECWGRLPIRTLYSITPLIQDPFSQTLLLHPIDDLAALGKPNVGKRLGVFDRLIVNLSRRRKSHLAVHREGEHLWLIGGLFVEDIEFVFERLQDIARDDAAAIHAGVIQSANRVFVGNNDHRLAVDAHRIRVVVVYSVAVPGKPFIRENPQCTLGMAHTGRQPACRPDTDKLLEHLRAGANLLSFLLFG